MLKNLLVDRFRSNSYFQTLHLLLNYQRLKFLKIEIKLQRIYTPIVSVFAGNFLKVNNYLNLLVSFIALFPTSFSSYDDIRTIQNLVTEISQPRTSQLDFFFKPFIKSSVPGFQPLLHSSCGSNKLTQLIHTMCWLVSLPVMEVRGVYCFTWK